MSKDLIPAERIENRILLLRGQKVMLSSDLAVLYEVEPRVLVQAVKRNAERFPDDFMFQLDLQEVAHLKSQCVTSSWGGLCRPAETDEPESGSSTTDELRCTQMLDEATEHTCCSEAIKRLASSSPIACAQHPTDLPLDQCESVSIRG
jgi:hypothetical protein